MTATFRGDATRAPSTSTAVTQVVRQDGGPDDDDDLTSAPLDGGAGAAPGDENGGCGCKVTHPTSSGVSTFGLIAIAALIVRRKRQRRE
ncbi:MAG TPA: MYXO-CTERM sorting domain-containing protein [Labilithrix sp.]|nr:MYXO-CTERM sorting domain-containing protein [Labilithrix sp.]